MRSYAPLSEIESGCPERLEIKCIKVQFSQIGIIENASLPIVHGKRVQVWYKSR
jgi:hypothetical protein